MKTSTICSDVSNVYSKIASFIEEIGVRRIVVTLSLISLVCGGSAFFWIYAKEIGTFLFNFGTLLSHNIGLNGLVFVVSLVSAGILAVTELPESIFRAIYDYKCDRDKAIEITYTILIISIAVELLCLITGIVFYFTAWQYWIYGLTIVGTVALIFGAWKLYKHLLRKKFSKFLKEAETASEERLNVIIAEISLSKYEDSGVEKYSDDVLRVKNIRNTLKTNRETAERNTENNKLFVEGILDYVSYGQIKKYFEQDTYAPSRKKVILRLSMSSLFAHVLFVVTHGREYLDVAAFSQAKEKFLNMYLDVEYRNKFKDIYHPELITGAYDAITVLYNLTETEAETLEVQEYAHKLTEKLIVLAAGGQKMPKHVVAVVEGNSKLMNFKKDTLDAIEKLHDALDVA